MVWNRIIQSGFNEASSSDAAYVAELQEWSKDSTVRDGQGRLYLLYHSSKTDFNDFLPFSHFGSRRAAHAVHNWGEHARRLVAGNDKRTKPNDAYVIQQVALNLKNPLIMTKDIGPHEGSWHWKDYFQNTPGILSDQEIAHIFDDSDSVSDEEVKKEMDSVPMFPPDFRNKSNLWKQRMILNLEDKGYDGASYVARIEDPGSTCFMTFRPEQVRRVFGSSNLNTNGFVQYNQHNSLLGWLRQGVGTVINRLNPELL